MSDEQPSEGLSRRAFLKGSGMAAMATAATGLPTLAPVAEAAQPAGQPAQVPAPFVRHDAQQCGFCTPGFVVAMKAVLEQTPKATPADIEKGLLGNICRCGTYEQMRDAIFALCNQKRS